MIFTETTVNGAYLISPECFEDQRGYFNRAFCATEFAEAGLQTNFVQANMSGSAAAFTLRGLHYQKSPHEETKVFRCIAGSVFDVVLDLRPGSSSYGKWYGAELSAENKKMLYIPGGCAHGYMTLEEHSEVYYLVTEYYQPAAEGGVRWNDPQFNIDWPVKGEPVLSEKDGAWPDFNINALT